MNDRIFAWAASTLRCLIAARPPATTLSLSVSWPWMSKLRPGTLLGRGVGVYVCHGCQNLVPGEHCQLTCLIATRHPATTLFRCVVVAMDVKIFAWTVLPTDMLDRGQAPCYDVVLVCLPAMDVNIFAWAALPTVMLDRGQAPCYDVVSMSFSCHGCQNLCLGSLAK